MSQQNHLIDCFSFHQFEEERDARKRRMHTVGIQTENETNCPLPYLIMMIAIRETKKIKQQQQHK